MCSIITHSLLGLGIARAGTRRRMPISYWIAAGILPMLPDLDTPLIRWLYPGDSFAAAVRRDTIFSHRGITHSLLFAVVIALLTTLALFPRPSLPRWRIWLILFIATASHPLTDMLTNGGSGVAIFSPFWHQRFFWPWRPVEVSPLSIRDFLNAHGWHILMNEALWVLLPAAIILSVIEFIHARRPTPA
jgi:inner membrane protein